jgi:hypothetical protein
LVDRPSLNGKVHGDTAARLAREVAGLTGDDDPARLPAALRRPGPQPCNQIPPTYEEAMRRLHAGRPRWPHLALWLRVARLARRLIRRAVARDLDQIAAAVARLEAHR